MASNNCERLSQVITVIKSPAGQASRCIYIASRRTLSNEPRCCGSAKEVTEGACVAYHKRIHRPTANSKVSAAQLFQQTQPTAIGYLAPTQCHLAVTSKPQAKIRPDQQLDLNTLPASMRWLNMQTNS